MGGESAVLIGPTILVSIVIGSGALALAAAGAPALAGVAAPAKPDILLVTLDTTRADRMGFLGSARGLAPALDAWSRTAT
ncbi:MAG TPA: hypothetical protein VF219_16250, partial [Vicinamibacterales bacterium]